MAWLLLIMTGLLCVLVVLVAVLGLRLRSLERRLAEPSASRSADWLPSSPEDSRLAHLDESDDQPEYVITHVGEPEVTAEPMPVVEPKLFADIVLRETVVHAAGLAHGLRRALAPDSRNRIRFEIRREIKRSRKQRRADLREARREWEARQRAAVPQDELAEDTAA